jgi:hypothetical protein
MPPLLFFYSNYLLTLNLLSNNVNGWATNNEQWVGEQVQRSKKKSLEHIPCHTIKYSCNTLILMPCGFAFCDVANYSSMKPKIFYHVDKGSTWKHKLFWQWLYLFVQMVFLICNINLKGFWIMETLDWVKDLRQMKFDHKCSKMVDNVIMSCCRT